MGQAHTFIGAGESLQEACHHLELVLRCYVHDSVRVCENEGRISVLTRKRVFKLVAEKHPTNELYSVRVDL